MNLKDRIAEIKKRAAAGEPQYSYSDLLRMRENENKAFIDGITASRKEKAAKSLTGRSGIMPLHQGCTVENFIAKDSRQHYAKQFSRVYIDNFDFNNGQGFIFSGTPGTGKNHLASAICNELIKSGKSCLVITITELMQKLRKCYQRDPEVSEDEFIQGLVNLDLLIIDEIGLQRGTDAEKITINQIIDQRVNNLRSTGILTNLGNKELESENVLGHRIMDRMKMNCGAWIPFQWESYRK